MLVVILAAATFTFLFTKISRSSSGELIPWQSILSLYLCVVLFHAKSRTSHFSLLNLMRLLFAHSNSSGLPDTSTVSTGSTVLVMGLLSVTSYWTLMKTLNGTSSCMLWYSTYYRPPDGAWPIKPYSLRPITLLPLFSSFTPPSFPSSSECHRQQTASVEWILKQILNS